MRQKELLDSIKKFFSRFEAQVKISSANNEYDINIHSENVIIPILNLVYNFNLKNANFVSHKNFEAIDLIDEKSKVAVQVTSTKELSKVKGTLTKLINLNKDQKIEELNIYMLREKQSKYSQSIINDLVKKRIKFDVKDNIIDSNDIYRKIVELNDFVLIEKIEELLRKQFSDIIISADFTMADLEDFRTKYTVSCLSNFSRINFFGLSIKATKPREIDLYKLFVKPNFSVKNELDLDIFTHFKNENSILAGMKPVDINVIHKINTLKKIDLKSIEIMDLNEMIKFFDNNNFNSLNHFEGFLSGANRYQKVNLERFFLGSKNIVIIGKAGAGKSSFIKYVICKLLEKDLSIFSNSEIYEYIPFRVELHKYCKFKSENRKGINEYIVDLLMNEYQISLKLENLKAIFLKVQCIFFFDGLDEIFDVQERLDVRNDIESFISHAKLSYSIVTSRFESYEEVQLSKKFTTYELLDFNDSQIEEYVKRWYSIDEKDTDVRDREVSNCLFQLKSVDRELKYNPLLLSLIVLLYRNDLNIPTSKLEIYESCTHTILESRDSKEKKLNIQLVIQNKVSVFASIAFWQYCQESTGNTKIRFESVRAFIINYLLERGEFDDYNLASGAADEFLDFARIRSIYFENKFTHKTFLEYFVSYYIHSYFYLNSSKANEFIDLLENYIGLSSWSIVLELLICKIDSAQIDYEVMDNLISKLFERNQIDTLIFLIQILKYVNNISPKKIEFIILNAIQHCFIQGLTSKELKIEYKEVLFSHLAFLYKEIKFKVIIEKCFKKVIENGIFNSYELSVFAYEFAIVSGSYNLAKILQEFNNESNDDYVMILKNYPTLFDMNNYLLFLKGFMKMYPNVDLSKVYNSAFNQKIFFKSEKFNWCVSYLFYFLSKNNAYSLYKKLIKLDIPKSTIVNSGKQVSAYISREDFERKVFLKEVRDSNFKALISNLNVAYKFNSNSAKGSSNKLKRRQF